MDAFQDRRFAAAQPPPPPPPQPPGEPPSHNLTPPPTYYQPQQQQQPFPHQEPHYPPYHHHHLPPPPFPYQQQWTLPDGYQGMLPQPQLPPYSQYPSHYPGPAGAPPQPPQHHHHHNQYPPHPGPPIPHTSFPPGPPHGHHLLSPSPPPQSSSAYPPAPPPNPGWGSQSWAQHQGWEYPGNYQSHSMPIGKAEEHRFALHDQNQSADCHIDTRRSSISQSSIHHPGIYTVEQQKQAYISHGPTSYPSGSIYGAEGISQFGAGDQAKSHLSPPRNYGPTSSIYEEVPYSYSYTPGNRLPVNQGDSLPRQLSYQSQEGFTGLQSNLPERNVTSEQLNFTHDGQPFGFVSDASNKPLDFHPRTAHNLEVCPKPSHGLVAADPIGSTGMIDPKTKIGTSVNAWVPTPPVAFPQSLAPSGTQFDSFASQQSLSLPHAPVFGGLAGPSFRPNMPHVNASFGFGAEHANQVAGYAADINGTFNISERPKKSAVPKWLQEEIIKNKSVIDSHNAASSHESPESEDAGKSYQRTDQDDQKSIDSTKLAEDDENDDASEAAKSAAINQEIKCILTEVLLKVTDEFFNQIATKVLDENDTAIEATTEHNDQENHKVSVPSVLTPKASAKVLVPLEDKSNKIIGVNNSPPLGGGNILGLANYASDEEVDHDEESGGGGDKGEVNQSMKLHSSSKLQESDSGSSAVENKRLEKSDVLLGSERKREYPNQNPRAIDIQNDGGSKSLQLSSVSDELHNKRTKGLSDVVGEHKSVKSGLLNDAADKRESRKLENTGKDATFEKSSTKEGYVGESKNPISISQHQGKESNNEDTVKKTAVKNDYHVQSRENRTSLKEKDNYRKTDQYKNAEQGADSEYKSFASMDRKESTRDKKEKSKEDSELKKKKETKEDHNPKDSVKYSSRRSPSPINRGRSSKESSSHGRGSISSVEPPDNSKKRKLHSRRDSTSRSPTRARARQVSRSPDRKHSHRRHSPYSSTGRRRRRSRSSSPAPRRR